MHFQFGLFSISKLHKSSIFHFCNNFLQKYDKIITNTIAVLSSSSSKRKQKDLFSRLSCSKWQAVFQNAKLLCCPFAELQKKTKSSQAPSHHLWKGNKRTCLAGFHVQSGKLFFRMQNSFVVLLQKYKKRQNHHKYHHIIFERETKRLVLQAFTFKMASCISECTTPLY